MLERRTLRTKFGDMVDIKDEICEIVRNSGVKDGICVVTCPHTTAALCIVSKWDPLGLEDIQDELNRMIPTRNDFKHQETPHDASGHIKSAIVGPILTLIVDNGELLLNDEQQTIVFAEFDGPRPREYFVKVM